MKAALERYLRESIDENISVAHWDGKKQLPLSLVEAYGFFQAVVLGVHCIFLEILHNNPGIDVLEKHLGIMNMAVDGHIVLCYKSITNFRRKSLIRQRIPFIVEDGQMYLPFLGLELKKAIDRTERNRSKFSYSTQQAFLYFLYHGNVRINATRFADILKTSVMTSSRVLNDLYDMGLLTYEFDGKTGRSKEYTRIGDPDYYHKGSVYLKNPINRIIYVEKVFESALVAGLDALSLISMINPPQSPIRAVAKERLKEIASLCVVKNRDRIADEPLVELEIWHYNPRLTAGNGCVDLVSLALSLEEKLDERIEQALEDCFRGEKWYTG